MLIDFWATWYRPCVAGVPELVAAYRKFHDQGFEIVGISLDDSKRRLTDFTTKEGMAWPQYFDGQGWGNRVSSRYGISSIPRLWLLGRDGRLADTDAHEHLAPTSSGCCANPERPALAPDASAATLVGMSKDRYIEAKQKWAEKQKARGFAARTVAATDRLPPGQKLTAGFPVLDLGVQPDIPHAEWKLSVDGLVEQPTALTWAALGALPQVEDVSDFHCVTTWSKYDCRWSGVAFTTLYELVRPRPEAQFVYFTGFDGYSTNVPLAQCLDDDVLLATAFDGAPVSREHGGPARVIIPKLYAWKGAKFVSGITFLAEDKLGFWELRGYSNTADPWKEERYA